MSRVQRVYSSGGAVEESYSGGMERAVIGNVGLDLLLGMGLRIENGKYQIISEKDDKVLAEITAGSEAGISRGFANIARQILRLKEGGIREDLYNADMTPGNLRILFNKGAIDQISVDPAPISVSQFYNESQRFSALGSVVRGYFKDIAALNPAQQVAPTPKGIAR